MSKILSIEVKKIQSIYITLTLFNTLASSFIWGINTLFLLDAGLSITEAFAANAFFTLGSVLFEVPTGVVADMWGRRSSYLLGTITLFLSTALYLVLWQTGAPFIGWAVTSMLLGLGFTFFSGAVEAWLVDALHFHKFNGSLESVFAKGQITSGVAMLTGSIAGGLIAQMSNISVPYILRCAFLIISFFVATVFMQDIGFKSDSRTSAKKQMKRILSTSLKIGFGKKEIRWVMLTSPFTMGIGVYAFYALQPYLLELYGDETAYGVAGLAAAVIAGSQIFGGLMVGVFRKIFHRRTSAICTGLLFSAISLFAIGWTSNFYVAVIMLVIWAIFFAVVGPIRQTYLNMLIPSKQRATMLSFDSLLGSAGGVVSQPVLGKAADVWSYSTSYMIAGAATLIGLPLGLLARRLHSSADLIQSEK